MQAPRKVNRFGMTLLCVPNPFSIQQCHPERSEGSAEKRPLNTKDSIKKLTKMPQDPGGIMKKTLSSPIIISYRRKLYGFIFCSEIQTQQIIPVPANIFNFHEDHRIVNP